MTKQEAAEYLEVSIRALERYVQQGKISVKYQKGKTRSTANFDEQELKAFKEELNQPSYKPAIETRQNTTNSDSETNGDNQYRQIATEDQYQKDSLALYEGEASQFGEITTIDKLASIIEGLIGKRTPNLSISDKILLTISEAQELTGLSREFLRSSIGEGRLKAKLIGRTWRLKRCDLDEYVENLF